MKQIILSTITLILTSFSLIGQIEFDQEGRVTSDEELISLDMPIMESMEHTEDATLVKVMKAFRETDVNQVSSLMSLQLQNEIPIMDSLLNALEKKFEGIDSTFLYENLNVSSGPEGNQGTIEFSNKKTKPLSIIYQYRGPQNTRYRKLIINKIWINNKEFPKSYQNIYKIESILSDSAESMTSKYEACKALIPLMTPDKTTGENEYGIRMPSRKLSSYYGNLSWYALNIKENEAAVDAARKGLGIFPHKWINTNLALGLAQIGEIDEALELYKLYKKTPFQEGTFRDAFISDIEHLTKNGIEVKYEKLIRKELSGQEIIPNQNLKSKLSSNELASSVKKNSSIDLIINWHEKRRLYDYPTSNVLRLSSLSELEKVSKKQAKEIKSLILALGKSIDPKSKIIKLDKFKNLNYLQINNTNYLPLDLSGLKKLRTLNFTSVPNLTELPSTIGELKSLEHLIIVAGSRISEIPENIYNLSNLVSLTLGGMRPKSKVLSKRISQLKKLEFLQITWSNFDIPDEISELKNLVELRLWNYGYKTPYQAIYRLPNLEILGFPVAKKSQFKGISKLNKLRVLSLGTDSLSTEISKIPNLEGLSIGYQESSMDIAFENMDKLLALRISANESMTKAPAFITRLKSLEYLQIHNCDNLSEFGEEYKEMNKVSRIVLSSNDLIQSIPENLIHIKSKIELR